MTFAEAFKVVPTGLKVNADVFGVDKDIEGKVRAKVVQIQKELDLMQSRVKTDLNAGQLMDFWQDVEGQLEKNIPDSFKGKYEEADWPTRANMIQTEILARLDEFIQDRLSQVIKTTSNNVMSA